MKALVVGGTGFVGMNLVRALVAAGHDVTATRRARSNTLFARKLGARLEHADLDDVGALTRVMRGREVVFMCAGHYPRFSLDRVREVAIARARARNAVDAALSAGVPRFVLTSSVATIGPPREGRALSDEDDVLPRGGEPGVYHAVKRAIEEETLDAHRRGLSVVALCPTAIMGSLDVKAGTGFAIVALAHQQLPFYVDGKTNVVDADDLAAAHLAAAARGASGARYVVGGHNLLAGHLLRAIADELGVPFRSWALPSSLAAMLTTLAEMRTVAARGAGRPFLSRELVDVVRHGRFVDCARATRDLGLPAPQPLDVTLRKACDWYRRHRYFPAAVDREARWRNAETL